MKGDSELAGSMTDMFSEMETKKVDAAAQKEADQQFEDIKADIKESIGIVGIIDRELNKLLNFDDFIKTLGGMPSDIDRKTLVLKTELRILAINQLLSQREQITGPLQEIGYSDLELASQHFNLRKPITFIKEIRVEVPYAAPAPQVIKPEPRPKGFACIRLGIKDLFTRDT